MPQLHITDDQLEMYALSGQADASIEEHLLVCEACRDRFDRLRRFILATRAAAKPDSKKDAKPRRPRRHAPAPG